MFFRKLELQGFKSFGNKQTIEFQPGFTIVVGPNGCGKSNVLDALRWVLGETSAKSLRGSRMGDVVFRGSSTMKAAGVASITLTLDNRAGHLPIDQSEVSITRRLFSSGDSEYQINKVDCRMRDIHELFLDTGLGADGYSIIEQGQIGMLVAAKPNERREIFEEAAGISRYKLRREETLRKLARTGDDLLRLEDLVGEVERQVGSLRHQARKAERHRRMTRRLHRLQQRLLVLRHEALSIDMAAAEARLAECNTAFESAAARCATTEAEITAAQERLDTAQREWQRLQQQHFEVSAKLARERHRVEMLNQQIAAIDERRSALDREIESRLARLTIMAGTREQLERDLAQEEKEYGEAAANLSQRQAEVERLKREGNAEVEALARLRSEQNEARARFNTVENDRRIAATLVERLAAELAGNEEALAQLHASVDDAEGRLATAQKQSAEIAEKLAVNRAESERLRAEMAAGDAAQRQLAERLETQQREWQRVASRQQALKELEDNFEGYFKGVKEIMQAASRNQLKGVVGVVSSLLTVPKELEIAVEVALGGDLQDIVTTGVDDAKAAIQFLKQRNLGRATFLPLDFLHSDFSTRHLDPIWGKRGVLGLGRDLVKFPANITPAVQYLFGNTVFVETLDIAVELERSGVRNRYVSLTGDLVNPRGVLSGGSHQTRGLLTRTRDIRDLADQAAALDAELNKLRAELAGTRDRNSQLAARAAELQAEFHALRLRESEAAKDTQSAERDRKERRNQLATADARADQQRVERARQEDIVDRCATAIVELQARLDNAAQQLAEREATYRGRAEEIESAGNALAAARDAHTRLAERVRGTRTRLEEMARSLAESERERAARQDEGIQLLGEREQAEVDRDEAEAGLAERAREVEELANAVAARAADNEALAVALRRMTNDAQGMLRDRNEADNRLREVQVQHAELRAQIGYVEREAEDEFALTIAEVKAELAAAEAAERERAEKAAAGEATADNTTEAGEEEEPATTAEDDAIVEPAKLRALVTDLRGRLQRLGAVNEAAIEEYAKQSERLTFITTQRDDLRSAKAQLEDAIKRIDETTKTMFDTALETIRANFKMMFQRLFNGGDADLILVHDEKYPEPGIEIYAQPPGKKIGGTNTLLSGGEKALTAIALMFSLFQYRPSPVCILDEIDAPLDDVNAARLCDALKQFAKDTQFLIITHKKVTMGLADTIYGVTMQEPGVSKLVSVKFRDVEEAGLLEARPAG